MTTHVPLPHRALTDEPGWPDSGGRPIVYLVDASSRFERRIIDAWIDRHRPAGTVVETIGLPPSRRRRPSQRVDARLQARLFRDDDPLLVPVRIVWLSPTHEGKRSVHLHDLLVFGDPRDPDPLRQRFISSRFHERCRLVLGAPAGSGALHHDWVDSREMRSLAEFVAHRAWLALERAERALRGSRYKVPKFLAYEILANGEFRDGLSQVAAETGRSEQAAFRKAGSYLREIAATHSPWVIDLVAGGIHWLRKQAYHGIDYDSAQFQELYSLGQRYPLAFLPSHKSNMDHLVLQYLLWENDLPPNHTAGGINMNFFPVGPLVRRTGVFFIRRSFKDNPLYKYVLRSYIGYLIEKRFSLEWFMEGGRSRSGKLLPPRYGMLAYVADAYRAGKSEDVYLIPTSIAYDQIQDVGSYASEQRGEAKTKESLGWLVRIVRSLRRRYGKIYLRFGEPLSLAKELPDGTDAGEHSVALRKIAFEVAVRINNVTPITLTSLVTLALLADESRALTIDEIAAELVDLLGLVEQRRLPLTESFDPRDTEALRATLDRLIDHDLVVAFAAGKRTVYAIPEDKHLAAAYYRNTIIHFFVAGAIAELALLAARAAGEDGDRVAAFWDGVMSLRDLLKFEFFFTEKDTFREKIHQTLALHDADWTALVEEGPTGIDRLLTEIRPLTAHWCLRPFLEAYEIVADALELHDAGKALDEKAFLASALDLGKLYRLRRKTSAEESVSQELFRSALRLADNRGLTDPRAPDLGARRLAFAAEIRRSLRWVDAIEARSGARRAAVPEPLPKVEANPPASEPTSAE